MIPDLRDAQFYELMSLEGQIMKHCSTHFHVSGTVALITKA